MLLQAGGTVLRWGLVLVLAAALVAVLAAWRRAPASASTAKSFLAHVEELRRRLLLVVGLFLVGTVGAFSFRVEPWRGAWLPVPALQDNLAAQVFRRAAGHLVPEQVRLVATSPLDGFLGEFTVAMAIGAAVALPALLVQGARFVGPALRPQERRALRMAFLPALALFAAGAAFAYLLVLPFMFEALYGYTEALAAEPLLAIPDFVTFTFGLLLVLGLAFQTPLLMAVLSRVGLVAPGTWLRGWRAALIAVLVVSALVTDPTVLSQLMVAAPLLGLYLLGAGAAHLAAPKT